MSDPVSQPGSFRPLMTVTYCRRQAAVAGGSISMQPTYTLHGQHLPFLLAGDWTNLHPSRRVAGRVRSMVPRGKSS